MDKHTYSRGLTTVKVFIDIETDRTYFRVTHAGNMRDRVSDVIENVRGIFNFDETVEFEIHNAKGSPDYMYKADFYFAPIYVAQ